MVEDSKMGQKYKYSLKQEQIPLMGTSVIDSPTIPNNGTSLMLKDITYRVKELVGPWWKGLCCRPSRSKNVLKHINLCFEQELTAILGSSGSGKTSLLDVISSRAEGKVSGSLLYSGKKCGDSDVKKNIAYVIQSDRLLPNLTVRETLMFSAYLRLPGHFSKEEIGKKVEKVINQMGLNGVAESRIGGTIVRGISGGEKRRVTIAVQLLQNPKILLLDEPTTGLDSCTSKSLMDRLRKIAEEGTTVIVTIHQPGSQLFKIFQKICLLSNGRLVFYGYPDEMLAFYTGAGYICPRFTNPLDFYVDLSSIDRRNEQKQKESEARLASLVELYRTSPQNVSLCRKLYADEKTVTRKQAHSPIEGPSVLRVLTTLLGRMTVNLGRDRSIYVSRVFLLSLFVPFICAFLGHLKNNQESIQDRVGLMYQSLSVPAYVAILNGVGLFPQIRNMYYRDANDGLYGTTTFMMAYILHIIPFTLFSSFVFSIIVYWVTGLYPEWNRFCIYYAVVFVLQFTWEIMTVGCMGVFLSNQIVNSTMTLILTASVLFASGLLRSLETMFNVFHWASWFAIHKYSTEILVANEFRGSNFTCPQDTHCQFHTGDDYINQFYPDATDNFVRNFGALGSFTVLFVIVTIMAFKIRGTPNLH